MPQDEDHEFDSLFDSDTKLEDKGSNDKKQEDISSFIEDSSHPDSIKTDKTSSTNRKRSSDDFEPDMDVLLITAQSSLIVEGIKYLTQREFSSNTLKVYAEAIKGMDLFIKILDRNPNNYYKLSEIINTDIDCTEVEQKAFHLYKSKLKEQPDTDSQKLKAFELLRKNLKNGYDKARVSNSIVVIKEYFLLSGGLDQDKITQMVLSNNNQLKIDIAILNQDIKLAVQLLRSGNYEIAKGIKGRDVNIFIIKASQLLAYYYLTTSNQQAEKYYRRMHENYKKYVVVR